MCFIRIYVLLLDVVFYRWQWGLVICRLGTAQVFHILSCLLPTIFPSFKWVMDVCITVNANFSFPFLSVFPISKGSSSDICLYSCCVFHCAESVLSSCSLALEWFPMCWCVATPALPWVVARRSFLPLPFQCTCSVNSGVCLPRTARNEILFLFPYVKCLVKPSTSPLLTFLLGVFNYNNLIVLAVFTTCKRCFSNHLWSFYIHSNL